VVHPEVSHPGIYTGVHPEVSHPGIYTRFTVGRYSSLFSPLPVSLLVGTLASPGYSRFIPWKEASLRVLSLFYTQKRGLSPCVIPCFTPKRGLSPCVIPCFIPREEASQGGFNAVLYPERRPPRVGFCPVLYPGRGPPRVGFPVLYPGRGPPRVVKGSRKVCSGLPGWVKGAERPVLASQEGIYLPYTTLYTPGIPSPVYMPVCRCPVPSPAPR